jgi:hypothetical protein
MVVRKYGLDRFHPVQDWVDLLRDLESSGGYLRPIVWDKRAGH